MKEVGFDGSLHFRQANMGAPWWQVGQFSSIQIEKEVLASSFGDPVNQSYPSAHFLLHANVGKGNLLPIFEIHK